MVSDPVAATDRRHLAADVGIPEGMFIGGERRAAIDGSTPISNNLDPICVKRPRLRAAR